MRRLSWLSRNEPEDGFTLVEVLVAMIIVATALVVLAGTMYTAFGSIGFSRQRDTATEMANQAMEQIKALSFSNLVMSVGDISSDPLVTCSSGGVAPCTFGSSPARTIPVVSSGALPPAPLYPHSITTTPAINGTTVGVSAYTVSSYVTFDAANNTQARIATVRVSWTHPVGGASPLVQLESTIFANGPLAAPAGHAYSAQAIDSPGTISITGTLLGVNLANVTFGPGSANAAVGADGTATASATVAQSALQLVGLTLFQTPPSTASASSAPGGALSGPTTTTKSDDGLISGVDSALLNIVDAGNLGITGGLGNTAVTKAVAANSATGAPTLLTGQTMPNSLLPFAQGDAMQSGPLSLGLNLSLLSLLGVTLGSSSTTLLSLTPLGNANPDVATVCQQSTSGAGCQTAMPSLSSSLTGVAQPTYPGGAIIAQAQKDYLDISVLGGQLLDIHGFVAAASAAAGPGLSGTGKSGLYAGSMTLLGAPVTLINNALPVVVNAVKPVATALGTLGVTANLSQGTASQTGNSASATSPLVLTVSASIANLLTINISINLGSVSASASYS